MSTEQTTTQTPAPSPLELSDADFLKSKPPVYTPAEDNAGEGSVGSIGSGDAGTGGSEEDDENDTAGATEGSTGDDNEKGKGSSDAESDATVDDPDALAGAGGEAPGGQQAEGAAAGSGADTTKPENTDDVDKGKGKGKDGEKTTPEATPGETATVNYEAEYKKLLTPFKASGQMVEVKSIEDARALMQMGAHFNKKMAALKPNLKILRTLENAQLLDETKLGFLIDLSKKDPAAISKLIADSGLNPMELDSEKANEYKQGNHSVSDQEIELDQIIDEIKDSPVYTKTLETVSQKWDDSSKRVIATTPQLLRVIHDHMDRGIYDVIATEVERERVFGRLKGLSDIEAYRQVGDAIEARGGFNHLVKGSSQDQRQSTPAAEVVTPKPKKVEDDKLKDKRKAASSPKTVAPRPTVKDFNPLAMSDEEFKQFRFN